MKKAPTNKQVDGLRPEYDLSKLKGGVRGKYYERARAGTNLVLIEPDLAGVFPDTDSVNRALRLLAGMSEKYQERIDGLREYWSYRMDDPEGLEVRAGKGV